MAGKLTLIWGSMFSGKTEELIRLAHRKKYAKKNVIILKPMIDDRYSIDCVKSHNEREIRAYNINHNEEISGYVEKENPDVICVDEVQFFEDTIVDIIKKYLIEGIDVIVSGLDIDFKGEPFAITKELAPISDECVKLHAVCTKCGSDAWISHRLVESKEKVVVGGAEMYTALCRTCYNKEKNKN